MFTGIISDIGTITKATQDGDLRLEIACSFAPDSIKLGDSIACNGVCLTVIEFPPTTNHQPLATIFAVQLSAETVNCAAPNQWEVGKKVNLERALKMGDTLDGHIVSGHVDGVASIEEIEKSGDSSIIVLSSPPALAKFIAGKGSVTLDGIALTVNKVEGDKFWINIIPHTCENTTLSTRKAGDKLNLEIDMLARYVARLMDK